MTARPTPRSLSVNGRVGARCNPFGARLKISFTVGRTRCKLLGCNFTGTLCNNTWSTSQNVTSKLDKSERSSRNPSGNLAILYSRVLPGTPPRARDQPRSENFVTRRNVRPGCRRNSEWSAREEQTPDLGRVVARSLVKGAS